MHSPCIETCSVFRLWVAIRKFTDALLLVAGRGAIWYCLRPDRFGKRWAERTLEVSQPEGFVHSFVCRWLPTSERSTKRGKLTFLWPPALLAASAPSVHLRNGWRPSSVPDGDSTAACQWRSEVYLAPKVCGGTARSSRWERAGGPPPLSC